MAADAAPAGAGAAATAPPPPPPLLPRLLAAELQGPRLRVAVTGARGYIGAHIVQRLLFAGHSVHGTVRGDTDGEATAFLRALPGAAARLRLFSAVCARALCGGAARPCACRSSTTERSSAALCRRSSASLCRRRPPPHPLRTPGPQDLMVDGAFDAPFVDCDAVMHCASPYSVMTAGSDAQAEIIAPAVFGTSNVLASVQRTPSVRTVVLTSRRARARAWR